MSQSANFSFGFNQRSQCDSTNKENAPELLGICSESQNNLGNNGIKRAEQECSIKSEDMQSLEKSVQQVHKSQDINSPNRGLPKDKRKEEEMEVQSMENDGQEEQKVDINKNGINNPQKGQIIQGLGSNKTQDFTQKDFGSDENLLLLNHNNGQNPYQLSCEAAGVHASKQGSATKEEKKEDFQLKRFRDILAVCIEEISGLKDGGTNFDVNEIRRFTSVIRCGEGAFGKVYILFDRLTKKPVAFKIVETNQDRELLILQIIKEAKNPKLLEVIELNLNKDTNHFTALMEYGVCSLKELIDRMIMKNYLWSEEDILNLYYQLLDQVQELQKLKIVHRDIKPANIIVDKYGKIKLTDFGLAEVVEKEGCQNMRVAGTPAFWPPEINQAFLAHHKTCFIDPYEADRYSINATIHLLMRESNIQGTVQDLLQRHPNQLEHVPLKELENLLRDRHYELLTNSQVLNDFEKIYTLQEFYTFDEIAKWLKGELNKTKRPEELVSIFILVGKAFKKNGNDDKALQCYQDVEELEKSGLNLDDKQRACLYSVMGDAALHQSASDAEIYYKKSFESKERLYGNQSFEIAVSYYDLGYALSLQQRHQEAVEMLEKGLSILDETPNEENLLLNIKLKEELGYQYIWLHRPKDGLKLFQEQGKLVRAKITEKNEYHASFWTGLGYAYLEINKPDMALRCLNNSLEIRRKIYGDDHASLVRTLNIVLLAQKELGSYENALQTLDEAVRIIMLHKGDSNRQVLVELLKERISIVEMINFSLMSVSMMKNRKIQRKKKKVRSK